MKFYAIDPGPEHSAWVLWDGCCVLAHGKEANEDLLLWLRDLDDSDVVVFEQVESFGMPVGREVFETVFWTGRMFEAVCGEPTRLPRREVKLHLCASARAKDANIRQALIDRFGGKDRAIGKKKTPGPLYGITADRWQALALAITWWDQNRADVAKGA